MNNQFFSFYEIAEDNEKKIANLVAISKIAPFVERSP